MRSLMQWSVIGLMAFLCLGTEGAGKRKRRQSFFSFPNDDYDDYDSRFNPSFRNRFDQQSQDRNQFFSRQAPANNGFFPTQGRVPFPSPIYPGPPAFIDSPQPTSTVRPDTMVTTASPAFFACMQNCPTTSEYNPICGTNRQLYFNRQKFDCAKRCGARAEVWRVGSCEGLFPMSRG